MSTKQTIAIIGASGKMGSAIAKSISKGNYRLLLCGGNATKLQATYNNTMAANAKADLEIMLCSEQAFWEADIVIIAVPYKAEAKVAKQIKQLANQKIVISISNLLNDTLDGLITASDTSAAEELQKLLPNSKVIKAFNNIFAADFESPVIDGTQIDAFIAGNDEDALQIVSEVVATAGFNPVIARNLFASRTLEQIATFVCSPFNKLPVE